MNFDFHATRAREARVRNALSKSALRTTLLVGGVILLLGWAYLVFFAGILAGHLLLVFVGLPLMLPIWYKAHLEELAVDPRGGVERIDQILEPELLGKLPQSFSPKQLAHIVGAVNGARFYGARFAISSEFIENISSESAEDTVKIWQLAVELSKKYDEKFVSSAAVTCALLFSLPEFEYYLAQLKLSREDIEAGLGWHEHIRKVIKRSQVKHFHGGIGRDLSFGWTPLLSRFGMNISEEVQVGGLLHREIEGHKDVLSQMIHVLAQPGRRNATLVGEVGVGKTTLVNALAQKLLEDKLTSKELQYSQIIALDSASLIANAKGRGELENLLIRLFNEAIRAKNIILFLDEAQLFLKDGTGSVDLSSILLPVLEGGGLRLIIALSDQEWLALSQTNPGLTQLMNRVVVSPLDETDSMRVMEDQVLLLEVRNKVTYMYQSLREAYKLAERFIRDSAFPGKGVKLLEAAAGFKEQEFFVTEKSVQQAIEKTFDVKVQNASTDEERDTLINLEGKIHERMINQTRAVQVVSDALRRARAGVRNQQRPIGTFLFLGPTGVGKTELSKSLAAVYFGGEDHMVRIDMNEYSGADDVSRLLAVPAADPFSLSSQISKQPFSVVLFDEIEKAHPNVLNVLLQMLDEGVLRDTNNKPVSFRDAIIIATSNAGAEDIRAHIERGEDFQQFEDKFVDELINKQLFRPEFLNRFDEIVLFRPLTKVELLQVVDLIVASLNKTLAAQKVSVTLTDSAKSVLVDAGYDPRLGARPLRRVVQRSIENIVAGKLLSGQTGAGAQLTIDAPEIQTALTKR